MKYCCKEDDVFYYTVMTITKKKTNAKTNTKTTTNTKTKTMCIEDPTYAIFLKSKELKDTDVEITKTNTKRYTKT